MRVTACVKCDGRRFLYLPELADLVGIAYDGEMATVRELAVTTHPDRNRRGVSPTRIRIGVLQAVVCVACGHVELYTKNPDQIWVDGQTIQPRGA